MLIRDLFPILAEQFALSEEDQREFLARCRGRPAADRNGNKLLHDLLDDEAMRDERARSPRC